MTTDNAAEFYEAAAKASRHTPVFNYNLDIAPPRWNPEFNFGLVYYLSGPMRGYPEHNFPAFEQAAQTLRNTGVILISPHELHKDVDLEAEAARTDYGYEYLKEDIAYMTRHTHGIILLKGWTKSKGACAELSVALSLDFPVWFYDNYTLTKM